MHCLQNDLKGAEELHKRALAIRRKLLDENHPDVANSLNNLASVYWRQVSTCLRD